MESPVDLSTTSNLDIVEHTLEHEDSGTEAVVRRRLWNSKMEKKIIINSKRELNAK